MEYKFLNAIDFIRGSGGKIVGQSEDVMLGLRGTFEDLIGSQRKLLKHCKHQANHKTGQNQSPSPNSLSTTIPYPFEAAISQINTMLDIATMLLRIERMCYSRRRIKDTLLENENLDDF